MSGFSSLNLGTRALYAAQRSLDVTGQNVSNANTEGYSRQRVEQSAAGGPVQPAMFARWDGAGDGVNVDGILRIRDDFLEARAQHEHATQSYLTSSRQVYADIETTFGEPSDSGLQSQLSSFWSSWDDVANDPGGLAPRSQLLERAASLAGSFNGLTGRLNQQWTDVREQLSATVTSVNAMAKNIAQLNESIRSATVSGVSANELSDQRDQLVLKLGEAVGATSTMGDDGVVNVTVGGTPLVTGSRSRELQVSGPSTYPGSTGSVSITWAADGYPVAAGGQAAALADAVNNVLPHYLSSLKDLAGSLAAAVNGQQAQGYTLNATAASTTPDGQPLFTVGAGGQLSVALTRPEDLAVSAAPPPALDGDNAAAMGQLAALPGGPDATYRSRMVELGVQAQSVNRQTDVQAAITNQLDNARQSVSGVSLDEEMANLVNYQHAYEAAAKFITTIDSTLDTLLHMTG